ncbi:MAG: VapE domain-containing protein [Saccharofermentanales bacterium]|jgi:predicted P-loop ATPase
MTSQKMKINKSDSIKNSYHMQALSFADFMEDLKEFHQLPFTYEEYSKFDNNTQSEIKDVGNFVFGELDKGKRSNSTVLSRTGFSFDYDDDQINVDQMKKIRSIMKNGYLNYVIYSTASYRDDKPSFRLLIPFNKPLTELSQFKELAKAFIKSCDLPEPDSASYTLSQCMHLPTHLKDVEPIFEYKTDGEYLDVDSLKTAIKTPLNNNEQSSNKQIQRPPVVPIDDNTAIDMVEDYVQHEGDNLNNYNNFQCAMFSIIQGYQENIITEDLAVYLMQVLAGDNEDWKVNNVEKFYQNIDVDVRTEYGFIERFGFYSKNKQNLPVSANPSTKDEMVLHDFRKYSNGTSRALGTARNVKAILDYRNIDVYYDVILKRPNFVTGDGTTPLFIHNPDPLNQLSIQLADFGLRHNFLQFSVNQVRERLTYLSYDDSRNIPKEKLKNAIDKYPNAKGEINNLINCFSFEDENDIYPVLITKWLNQIAAMVCNDHGNYGSAGILVLQGKQEIGKSYFGHVLSSYFGEEYFVQNITFNAYGKEDKDQILKANKCVIGELSEFETTPKMMNFLKAFITDKQDIVRRPYDRMDQTLPRQSTFYATTNKDEFLDDVENRRFWVIPVTFIDTTRIKNEINHTKLWAEVYNNFLTHGQKSFRLTLEERLKAETISNKRITKTPEEIAIKDGLAWNDEPSLWRYQTSTQIAEDLGLPVSANRNVGLALNKMGYDTNHDHFKKKMLRGVNYYSVPAVLPKHYLNLDEHKVNKKVVE